MAKNDLFTMANRKGRELQAGAPRALHARYDRRIGRIVIVLSTGVEIAFSPSDVQGLEKAIPAQLAKIEISPSGFGLHFPAIDADLYLPALLMEFLGSRKWMAERLGAAGGSSRSPAKVEAARKNGRRGGRPRLNVRTAA